MDNNGIYSNNHIEFLKVAAEYCKYLEQSKNTQRAEFLNVMRRLLPMIYLKISFIPEVEEPVGFNSPHVTEQDYNYIQSLVEKIMGEYNDYLDTFVEDFKYTDQPVLCTISEGLADIYQVLRNHVEVYRSGFDEAIEVSTFELIDTFKNYWGQVLLNTLKAIHFTQYNSNEE
jgi:hypothetical protein